MKIKEREIIVVLLLFLVTTTSATKIELGSTPGNTIQTIYPGDSGIFTVSLFNMGNDQISLSTELVYDREINVDVAPKNIILSNEITKDDTSSHKSWLIIDDGKTYVRLYDFKVYVHVPNQVSKKEYKIKLIATGKSTASSDSEGYGQTMAQVREFNFIVNTIKTSSPSNVEDTDEDDIEYDSGPIRVESTDDEEPTSDKSGGKQSGGSGDTSTGSSSSGSSLQGGTAYESTTKDSSDSGGGGFLGINQDDEGNTNIDLPVGKITLDKGTTETAVDIGLITLVISALSLVVRMIK